MDKFQVAHEWAMKFGKSTNIMDRENTVDYAWEYADAMQAEADKRKEKGIPESLKPHEHNWENVTVMGDNVAKFVCADCGAVKHDVLEWQPDWSQAPKHMNYFFMDRNGSKFWTVNIPEQQNSTEHVINFTDCGGDCYAYASDQDYKGDWRNSLRKRPQ